MDLLNHDLAHEFPQYLEKIRHLRSTDRYFASLFTRYNADNQAITSYEHRGGSIRDDALEALKKKRLKTKDEIYQMLKAS
ncbi:MAG: GTP-binding protein [Burkholderiales bacterium RIFCSPHIGHO2_12_FULL_61_11]|nr:MAG: GTP-binding protein [Burkholderiales bacterium RIFCSPHIGHO2_12_FULL_61_11]